MTSTKKIYLAVASGLVAVGLVFAAIGFILSGFNPAVFSTQIDLRESGAVVLGGVKVNDPESVPFINLFAEFGKVEVSAPETPGASIEP